MTNASILQKSRIVNIRAGGIDKKYNPYLTDDIHVYQLNDDIDYQLIN